MNVRAEKKLTEKYKTYLQYLNSDHWQQLRRSKLQAHGCFCDACQSVKDLECHHIHYRNYTDCSVGDLAVLCVMCHKILHRMVKLKKASVDDFELPAIVAVINEFKASPKYPKMLARIERRKIKINGGVVNGILQRQQNKQPKRVYHAMRRRFNRCIRQVRNANYSHDSIEACIAGLRQLLALPPVNLTEVICNYAADDMVDLDVLKTSRGGFKRKTLEALGVPWPPPKGWKKMINSTAPKQ